MLIIYGNIMLMVNTYEFKDICEFYTSRKHKSMMKAIT